MSLTVHAIRKSGFKVHVNHYRYIGNPKHDHNLAAYFHIRNEKWQNRISPKGGLTTIDVYDRGSSEPLFHVQAKCSLKDAYNRKIALNVCLGRLESQMLDYMDKNSKHFQAAHSDSCGCNKS